MYDNLSIVRNFGKYDFSKFLFYFEKIISQFFIKITKFYFEIFQFRKIDFRDFFNLVLFSLNLI
jgi:hypothetical protein